MSNDESRFPIRSEARPLRREELSGDQWKAIERIAGQLRRLAKLPWPPASASNASRSELTFLAPIDAERRSSVFMIDGERGSGKTATLITLVDALNQSARLALDSAETLQGLLQRTTDGPFAERWVAPDPDAFVLPLEVLDVRPQPPERPIALMLLGAFESLVERSLLDGDVKRSPSHLPASQRGVQSTYEALLRSASLGWSAKVPTAGPGELFGTDIDLQRIDHYRRLLLPAFREFLDVLVADVRGRHGKVPLFVLAVDDLDLNPQHVDELLDFARAFWHPRLAFVLAGDIGVAHEKMMNVFADEISPSDRTRGIAVERGRQLAHAHIEKVIPTEHRARLPELDPAEARRLFEKLLRNGVDAHVLEQFQSPLLEEALPRGIRALQAAADECATLIRQHEPSQADPLEHHVGRLLVGATWGREVDRHLYDLIQFSTQLRTRITFVKGRLEVDVAAFVPYLRARSTISLRRDGLGIGAAQRVEESLAARSGSDVLDDRPLASRSPFEASSTAWLPDQVARIAWLAIETMGDHSAAQTFARRLADGPHVVVTHFDAPGGFLLLRWPTPRWQSVSQYRTFVRSFEEALKRLDPPAGVRRFDEIRRAIACSFIESVAKALAAKRIDEPRTSDSPGAVIASFAWESGTAQDFAMNRLGLLATPEAGLEASDADGVFDVVAAMAQDRGHALAHLVGERHEWVRTSLERVGREHLVDAVLGSFDRSGSKWSTLVEPARRAQSLFPALRNSLLQFGSDLIDRLFSGAREQLFNQLPPDVQRVTVEAFRRAARGRRGEAGLRYLLADLWREFAPTPFHDDVRLDGQNLVVRFSMRIWPEPHLNKHLPLTSSTVLMCTPVTLHSERDFALNAGEETRLEFVYRLAWDCQERQISPFVEPDLRDSPPRVEFPGIWGYDAAENQTKWIGPAALPISFWERLVHDWNEIARELVEQREPEEHQRFVDALALTWIEASARDGHMMFPSIEDDPSRVDGAVRLARHSGSWGDELLRRFAREAPGISSDRRTELLNAIAASGGPGATPASDHKS